jgi:hypothetical protein
MVNQNSKERILRSAEEFAKARFVSALENGTECKLKKNIPPGTDAELMSRMLG